jgi:hypothetical protein
MKHTGAFIPFGGWPLLVFSNLTFVLPQRHALPHPQLVVVRMACKMDGTGHKHSPRLAPFATDSVPCPPAGGKPFCRPASITYTRKSLFDMLTLQLRFKAQGLDMGSGTDRKGRSKSERTSLVYRVLYCKRASRFASAHFCGTRSSSRKETELPYSLGSMPMWATKLP